MAKRSPTLIVAAVLAGGVLGLLAGCSETPADEAAGSPVPTPSQVPADRPLPPVTTPTDRAPLGFEVRYVDADGRFQTVAPEDFPR